ncbi:endoribonuclease Dicer homolog 2 isoform X2 [Malania oleifera]|uniref:endoribonuclease Dicer homolog 2 isoform X2 n=1 Tax=Malania oleifera TaxID=397392 RepID=UPI0025AE5373|nr:endoribonuclease Dicer homolog 2 isoform X2 [Malania oleifera]
MEAGDMMVKDTHQPSADPLPFARSYQLEALEKALEQNTIVFLETGSGKTLIAIMLLRNFAYLIRKPSRFIAVFLVPQVVLIKQQAEAVKMHTDLKVGIYWGDMGVDFWDDATWRQEQDKYEVLVMTPMILLNGLRHSFFKLEMIKLLIFDECHHARGKHPYACIMMEFYHRKLNSEKHLLPRILGMTASLVKSKGPNSPDAYWKSICDLENLMNSKVYTCINESVLAEFIPFSNTKWKIYKHMDIPVALNESLESHLNSLKIKHECTLEKLGLKESAVESVKNKISRIYCTFMFCLNELGLWLALKAAESLSTDETDILCWGQFDLFGETIIKDFSKGVLKIFSNYIPSDWSIGGNMKDDMDRGFLSVKVIALIESLMEYSSMKDLRCIIFVERVITAVTIKDLLSELLVNLSGWKTEYVAGNNTGLQSQTRKQQNRIVEEFRKGDVNIIVATSILEEGLDVQSCNLVIRFDLSANVCSFIQSRGRARVQNSDYLLMMKSGDEASLSRVKNYLSSGEIMREESLRHSSTPCAPLENALLDNEFYCVKSTGAIVTLSSSVALIHFYCSRLPSDRYFKSCPRCVINEEMKTCILYLPKSCPIQTVHAQGNTNILKQIVCLEACRQLHKIGALTDNLVPEIVVEEAAAQELGNVPYDDEKVIYFPPELVNYCSNNLMIKYHCYVIELERKFQYDIPVRDIALLVRSELELDVRNLKFNLEADRGHVALHMKYVGLIDLSPEHVSLCRKFQITLFRVLLNRDLNKLKEVFGEFHIKNNEIIDYLLLPSASSHEKQCIIDWKCIRSVLLSSDNVNNHENCLSPKGYARMVQTKNGIFCSCMLENCVVCTPHNSRVYCVDGFFYELDGNSLLSLRNGEAITYKKYYESRHGIELHFEHESLLKGRPVFQVQNYLQRGRLKKDKEPSNTFVELPPELCFIIMSPISISTLYSFSFVPSVMHRIESLFIAANLKKLHLDHCTQNVNIPTIKVLEAITTNKCQENFHLESLETLGDSFLKYATSQQLFFTYQNHHEGLLSINKDKIISNAALCKLGCNHKLPGFIRNECFDPKKWIIPGEVCGNNLLPEQVSPAIIMYIKGKRKIKSKTVADVVEALIGAFLCTGGEKAAILFLEWLGIEMDFANIPYERDFSMHPERFVNIHKLQSLLNYPFHDPSLLVEALTHGSYMLPEIPRCYQRLEFLGDSVLDYLMTMHLYHEYPGMSPGLLTDLRSASVNNDCYARSAVKAGLHRYILHYSPELHKQIIKTVNNFEQLPLESTFGWESEKSFPKVLGDIIESLAGAIFVDSGYNKEAVFKSIRPLLEPLITPETVKLHPVRELNELCQKQGYAMKKPMLSRENGVVSLTVEVEANGIIYTHTCTASEKKVAKKVASKEVLTSLKCSISRDVAHIWSGSTRTEESYVKRRARV